jgi:hypothetical protein
LIIEQYEVGRSDLHRGIDADDAVDRYPLDAQ